MTPEIEQAAACRTATEKTVAALWQCVIAVGDLLLVIGAVVLRAYVIAWAWGKVAPGLGLPGIAMWQVLFLRAMVNLVGGKDTHPDVNQPREWVRRNVMVSLTWWAMLAVVWWAAS